MLLVLLGRKFMPVDRGFHLKTSSLMGSEFTSIETPILSVFLLSFSAIRRSTRRFSLTVRFVAK